MLLTIGMIVKNEEKYLERCLNGIKPILEQVDSELIIADTGSTDRTVEIAKQFTDNVFYFEWIKDFAAARNSTLEKAQGEWFMFVDADEIFESCDEIIHFFNSGEYKKYNSASYIQRNILRKDDSGVSDDRISDFRAPRMTKILPDTKFYKPIHECLTTFGHPIKYLDDFVMHVGYSYAAESEQAKEKFQRNSELLLQSYNAGELNALLFIQLYESFGPHEPKRADEYLDEGIAFCEKNNEWMLTVMYSTKAGSYYGDRKYEEVLQLCEKYYKLPKSIRPGVIGTDVDMSAAEALGNFGLGNYEKAIERFICFFGLFKDYCNGKLNTNDVLVSSRTFARPDNFLPMLVKFVDACVHCNKYSVADQWLKVLPINKYSRIKIQVNEIAEKSMKILEYFDFNGVEKYYSRYKDEDKKIFLDVLERTILSNSKPKKAAQAMLKLRHENPIYAEKGRLYVDFYNGEEITAERLISLSERFGTETFFEILYLAIARKLDITQILSIKDFKAGNALYFSYSCIKDFHGALEAYSVDCITVKNGLAVFAEFMLLAIRAALSVKGKGTVFLKRNTEKLFELYVSAGEEYQRRYPEIDAESIPDVICTAIMACDIVKLRRAKDYKGCIGEMRKVIELYPIMTTAISEYRNAVMIEYEESRPKSEMEILMGRIKENIRNFIKSGDIASASKTLSEYEKINPSDPDIAVLKNEVR